MGVMAAMVLAMLATEVTTLARGRLRLSLDTLVLAMAMAAMVLAMLDTEATTLARGKLRLSLATLVLALAMLAMVLEATMATEATTLARGRLRLSLATLALAMAMAAMVLAMLATEATTLASKCTSIVMRHWQLPLDQLKTHRIKLYIKMFSSRLYSSGFLLP